ncbi:MAG: ectoine synthase [Pseudomonadota bacterium]
MIVKTLQDLAGTKGDTRGAGWSSQRFLLAEDGMGFTLTETTITAGTDHVLWYKHHLEACYCIDGEGEVEDLATGALYQILPSTCYALDQHERHRFKAITDMRLVCVFTPALTGGEVHDEDGAYVAATPG